MDATSSVAEIMQARAAERNATAEAQYRDLIRQMATDSQIDAEAAAITVEALGRTVEQVQADVARQRERIALAQQAAEWASAVERHAAATDHRDRYAEETRQIIEARKAAEKANYDAQIDAGAALTHADHCLAKLAADDPRELRQRAGDLQAEMRSLVRDRIAARNALSAAQTALDAAKATGKKKAELANELAAVEAAKIENDLLDSLFADWADKWSALNAERLTLPPIQPAPKAAPRHQFGPGVPA
jgi:hypothetical protein